MLLLTGGCAGSDRVCHADQGNYTFIYIRAKLLAAGSLIEVLFEN